MMLRLSPRRYERLRRTSSLELRACGAQFNIAADLAALGKRSLFLTRLPDNELGYLSQSLAVGYGVDMTHSQFVEAGRMGLIFAEFGQAPRRNVHLYDREGSAASTITAGDFDWPALVSEVRFAYTDGIFPALNSGCQSAALAFLSAARQAGCTTCFDINYRESLWHDRNPLALYRQALPLVDVLVTNRGVERSWGTPAATRSCWPLTRPISAAGWCASRIRRCRAGAGTWRSLRGSTSSREGRSSN
jgi:2-dehydro-3-deoxygluconokinase